MPPWSVMAPGSPSFCRRNTIESYSFAIPQALAGSFDSLQEPRVILQLVVEPVFIGGKTDKDARGLAVARNDQSIFLRDAQIFREIVLNFGQGHLFHRFHHTFRAIGPFVILGRWPGLSPVSANCSHG